MSLILIILMGIVLAIVGALIIEKRGYDESEEERLREVVAVSPSIRIVAIVMREYIKTIAFAVVLIVLILSSLLAAFSVSAQLLSTVVHMESKPFYSLLALASDIEQVELMVNELQRGIIVIQLFKYVDIELRNESVRMMPLILLCRDAERLPVSIELICKAVEKGFAVVDLSYNRYNEVLINGVKLPLHHLDLRQIVDTEIMPGLYFVHTLGTVGSTVIHVRNPRSLIILPLNDNVANLLCMEGCALRGIMLEQQQTEIDKLVQSFDIVGYVKDTDLVLMSRVLIPSLQSLVGVALSIIISVLVSVAAASGLVEKLRTLGTALVTQGVTSILLRVATGVGLFTILSVFGLILIVLYSITLSGIQATAGIVTYFVSSIALSAVVSHRAVKPHEAEEPSVGIRGSSYAFEGLVEPDALVQCLKNIFSRDEFFELNEIEKLLIDKRRFLMRLELIYKYAMAVLVSVEIEAVREDSAWIFKIVPEVWSFEELEKRKVETVALLAQSRVSGGLRLCLET